MPDRRSERALADFISEAQETIETLDKSLALLDETRRGGEADPDTLNAVFRAAHSLKGLAAMFGVERMLALAHALEDRLDDVRMGRRPLDTATLGILGSAPVVFRKIIAEEAGQEPPASAQQAGELAVRLRGRDARDAPAADPVSEVILDDSVRAVLTEYEEHRLRANLERGARLYRVRVAFDLATFDTGLEELKMDGTRQSAAPPSPIVELCTFRVGDQEYVIDLRRIREILQPLPITPVPHAPDSIEGVMNLRGEVIPVVDVRKRLGSASASARPKVLVVNVAGRVLGLVVDAVSEVVRIPRSAIGPPPLGGGPYPRLFLGVCGAREARPGSESARPGQQRLRLLLNVKALFDPPSTAAAAVAGHPSAEPSRP